MRKNLYRGKSFEGKIGTKFRGKCGKIGANWDQNTILIFLEYSFDSLDTKGTNTEKRKIRSILAIGPPEFVFSKPSLRQLSNKDKVLFPSI